MARQGPAVLVAVLATAAVASGCGSSAGGSPPAATSTSSAASAPPVPSTPAAESTPAREQQYASELYGYRIRLRGEWSPTLALIDWDGTSPPEPRSRAIDLFTGPDFRRVVVGATRLPKQTSLADWTAAAVRSLPGVCAADGEFTASSLGGQPAEEWTSHCSDGYDARHVTALHGAKGYMLFLVWPTATADEAADRQLFDSIRRSFRFVRG